MSHLHMLLQRLCDGPVSPAELVEVRTLLAESELSPMAADPELFLHDPAEDAAAVLAMLDDDGLAHDLAAALAEELGHEGVLPAGFTGLFGELGLEPGMGDDAVVSGVMASLADDLQAPVAQAVLHEAGPPPEVAGPVGTAIGSSVQPVPVAAAVRFEAGPGPEVAGPWSDDLLSDLVKAAVLAEAGPIDVTEVVIGEADPAVPVAAAVRSEAGRTPAADGIFAELEIETLPLAAAVRAEAGEVDVRDAVFGELGLDSALPEGWLAGLLDHQLDRATLLAAVNALQGDLEANLSLTSFADVGRHIREAVPNEAGAAPVLWADVATAIGIADPEAVEGYDATEVAAAVRAEAGSIDVTALVMEDIRRDARALEIEVPEPANTPWPVAAAVLLAAALMLVVGPRLAELGTTDDPFNEGIADMAKMGEVDVNELSYGPDHTVVVQVPDDSEEGAALIIWVDEEAQL